MTQSDDDHHHLTAGQALVVDLADVSLTGPTGVVWAVASPQLNANLVVLRAGGEIQEHINDEVDVLVVTQSGEGDVVIDGERTQVGSASLILIPRGTRRSINSTTGLTYFSIHQRPAGLSVQG